jgi:gluconate 2-dehydrogenase gamma chain
METRRQALKILGAVGATCAFPFAADELYGQHPHSTSTGPEAAAGAQPSSPVFFTADEYRVVERLADLIIPPTDTPGAVSAGVPEYIGRVVHLNDQHQLVARWGVAWLDREAQRAHGVTFISLPEAGAIAILQPLSDEVDRLAAAAQRARFRADEAGRLVYHFATTDRTPPARHTALDAPLDATMGEREMALRFFRLMKNLTADGYYTSRIGLLDELRYPGNTALAAFPACTPEA